MTCEVRVAGQHLRLAETRSRSLRRRLLSDAQVKMAVKSAVTARRVLLTSMLLCHGMPSDRDR